MMELASLNKVTSMVFPIYLDRNAMTNTSGLDNRFQNLVKFVVQNDTITQISEKGETVAVPEDGYLIVMSGDYRDKAAYMFEVGDQMTLDINSSVNLDGMETAFGGGGKLLVMAGPVDGASLDTSTASCPSTA